MAQLSGPFKPPPRLLILCHSSPSVSATQHRSPATLPYPPRPDSTTSTFPTGFVLGNTHVTWNTMGSSHPHLGIAERPHNTLKSAAEGPDNSSTIAETARSDFQFLPAMDLPRLNAYPNDMVTTRLHDLRRCMHPPPRSRHSPSRPRLTYRRRPLHGSTGPAQPPTTQLVLPAQRNSSGYIMSSPISK